MLYKPAVLFKVSRFFLVLALCLTLGFHWYALQSVAWVGMIVNYSCQGSFKEAVNKTFDGKHPCPLCKMIRAGKAKEKKSDVQQNTAQKLDLFAEDQAAFEFPPRAVSAFPVSLLIPTRAQAPPSPPPRPFFG